MIEVVEAAATEVLIHGDARAPDVVEVYADQVLATENLLASVEVGYISAGVPGPPGPPAQPVTHVQATPSASWVIPHELGHRPHVTVLDNIGTVIQTDVHIGENTVSIVFASPTTGVVVLS
ncbi:hypothetical protein GCM10010149_47650 [Nonomuraea roseoviolacea subsp. roseoviolacea]|uniref:hypothetical protein n=1 Tax=Nonomuraea roseoviolacea TaxID=103837 RepID=UPI0031D8134E